MTVGFTGTLAGMTARQRAVVTELLKQAMPTEVHHGDAVGADTDFHRIARSLGYPVVIHPPEDPKLRAFNNGLPSSEVKPPKPYLKRNHGIVDASDLLIATPKQSSEPTDRNGKPLKRAGGTWATIRYARKQGVDVHVVYP